MAGKSLLFASNHKLSYIGTNDTERPIQTIGNTITMSNNLGTGSGGIDDDSDSTPMPNFNASNIQLSTVAPAFGIPSSSLPSAATTSQPDYLDYDQKGRGIVSTMFTNSGISYMLGVTIGGIYGLREGLAKTPSSRFKVKLNSVLNNCGRYGSSVGNMMGATAILYSLYEGLADNVSFFFILCTSCVQFIGLLHVC